MIIFMFGSSVELSFLGKNNTFPIISSLSIIDHNRWFQDYKEEIDKLKLKYGGILFRNFKLDSVSEFNKLINSLEKKLLDYQFRSTPRKRLGGKIFTATEYPSEHVIPLHNENSYTNSWPNNIYFFCVVAPTKGGETSIADSRNVYGRIDQNIMKKFSESGVMYTRSFIPGIDLSWQEVFQTEEKKEVDKYCEDNNIEHKWLNNKNCVLKTKQICQAIHKHPVTNEIVWFNQAHLFHISSLAKENIEFLLSEVGKDNLPRNAYYGNGEEIEEEALEHIRECYDKEKIKFRWQEGDLMVLDNILFAHGREPFAGPRKIVVGMS